MILFYKYHGTGNDFVLIDNRNNHFKADNNQIAFICNRRLGIGADGIILLENKKGYDFFMRYFNSDGSEGSMCGNGGRCAVAFANHLGIISDKAKFYGADGAHSAVITDQKNNVLLVNLKLKNVNEILKFQNDFIIDTGSPHYIRFVKSVKKVNVESLGGKLRNDKKISEKGVNVDFVEITKTGLFVRTYERGVEQETLSCGTGVTASALVYSYKNNISSPILINTLGGKLKVHFKTKNNSFTDVWLEAPATFVFSGGLQV